MVSLDDLVRKERNVAWAYIDKKEEFKYLDRLNDVYFCGVFNMRSVYDFSLDAYSYWKKNKVLNAKHESLISSFRMMYDTFERLYCEEE